MKYCLESARDKITSLSTIKIYTLFLSEKDIHKNTNMHISKKKTTKKLLLKIKCWYRCAIMTCIECACLRVYTGPMVKKHYITNVYLSFLIIHSHAIYDKHVKCTIKYIFELRTFWKECLFLFSLDFFSA